MLSQRGERNAESVSDLAIVPSRDDKQDDLLLAHRQAAFRHELGSGVVPPLDALSRCLLFEQRSEFQCDVGGEHRENRERPGVEIAVLLRVEYRYISDELMLMDEIRPEGVVDSLRFVYILVELAIFPVARRKQVGVPESLRLGDELHSSEVRVLVVVARRNSSMNLA